MSFPIPHFDDDSDDEPFGEDIDPRSSNCARVYTEYAKNGLLYDARHPIYSTESCTVYAACTDTNDPHYYALKTSSYVSRLRGEHEIYLQVCPHPTTINCYSFWIHKGSAWLQLELASGGCIKNDLFNFDRTTAVRLFADIAYSLYNIHSLDLMHLDVSPANILRCETNVGDVFKLCDMGTTLQVGKFEEDCEGAGPYVSPETLGFPNLGIPVGCPTDIFSFGVVMMEVLTHKAAPRSYPKYDDLRNGKFDLSIIPEEFAIVRDMLNPDPNKRPTSEYLVNLSFIHAEIKRLEGIVSENNTPPGIPDSPVFRPQNLPPETPYIRRYKTKPGRQLLDDL